MALKTVYKWMDVAVAIIAGVLAVTLWVKGEDPAHVIAYIAFALALVK